MVVSVDLLLSFGATYKKVKRRQIIFYEGDPAVFFYQIIEGKVKMVNISDDGSEYIQGIFENGDSFGEPPLFYDAHYPASAVACEETLLIKLPHDIFKQLLRQHTNLMENFLKMFANRLRTKSLNTAFLLKNNTEKRILNILSFYSKPMEEKTGKIVQLSRQDVADLCGLRVETVIRNIKKMETKGLLKIVKGKVILPI